MISDSPTQKLVPIKIGKGWCFNAGGKKYQAICSLCLSEDVEKINEYVTTYGNTYNFACNECKKPVSLSFKV